MTLSHGLRYQPSMRGELVLITERLPESTASHFKRR